MKAGLWHGLRIQGKELRAVHYLYAAIATGAPVEVYAQTGCSGFWYKAYFMTPCGVLKSDTGGEHLDARRFAWRVIRSQELRQVSVDELMRNWYTYGVWEISRPIGATFVRHWVARQLGWRSALCGACAALPEQADHVAQLLAGLAGRNN